MTRRWRLEAGFALLAWLCGSGFAALAQAGGVTVNNRGKPGGFEVQNAGPEMRLSWTVKVEKLQDGAWVPQNVEVELAERCNMPKPAACVTLASGARLRPPPWNGLSCASQCAGSCRANSFRGPGTFRIGVSDCNRSWTQYGPPFQMPGPQ